MPEESSCSGTVPSKGPGTWGGATVLKASDWSNTIGLHILVFPLEFEGDCSSRFTRNVGLQDRNTDNSPQEPSGSWLPRNSRQLIPNKRCLLTRPGRNLFLTSWTSGVTVEFQKSLWYHVDMICSGADDFIIPARGQQDQLRTTAGL